MFQAINRRFTLTTEQINQVLLMPSIQIKIRIITSFHLKLIRLLFIIVTLREKSKKVVCALKYQAISNP